MARSRRLGRAREILAFLGKKVGKLYFWEEVVSTFPLALFDHFQKFTCAEEASRRNRFWNQMWSQKGDSASLPTSYTKFCVAKRADFQTRKSNLIGDFMCKSRFNLNLGNVRSTLSRTKIA